MTLGASFSQSAECYGKKVSSVPLSNFFPRHKFNLFNYDCSCLKKKLDRKNDAHLACGPNRHALQKYNYNRHLCPLMDTLSAQ